MKKTKFGKLFSIIVAIPKKVLDKNILIEQT